MNDLLTRTKRGLDGFLFESCDPRTASLLRIGYAVLVVICTIVWMLEGKKWFSDSGIISRDSADFLSGTPFTSLFYWTESPNWLVQTCLWMLLIQGILLGLGVFSRFQSACIFFWLVTLHARNPIVTDGEDTLMRFFAFFMIFMPLDNSYSLWKWIREIPESKNPTESAWAIRLIQFEMAAVYFSTAWCKVQGETWQQGTSMYYVSLMEDYFGRVGSPSWVFDNPVLVRILTWSALAIEFYLPFGLWFKKTRWSAIILGVLLHLGIEVTMNLFLFEWLMILGLCTFIPWPKKVDQANI